MTKIKAAFVTTISVLFNFLGILAIPIFILLGCNIFDYWTGINAAPARAETVKSYKSIRGIVKKVCMYILIIVGWFVDTLIGTTLAHLIVITIPPVFAITITCWLIFNEIISILENVDDIGANIPPFLMPLMKRIRGQIEEKGNVE